MAHSISEELVSVLKKIEIPQRLNLEEISEKSQFDYVTSFDLFLDKTLRSFLKERFPNHEIYSEEDHPTIMDFEKSTWIIDPLDGTSNFMGGIPFFSTTIALVEEGQVQFGFVYDFLNQESFHALRGKGFFINEARQVGKRLSQDSDLISLSSGTIDRIMNKNPEILRSLRQQGRLRILGSQALALSYVAAGRLKANFSREAKIWDDIAGTLLLKEAGYSYQTLTDFNSEKLTKWDPKKSLFSLACSPDKKDNFLTLFK